MAQTAEQVSVSLPAHLVEWLDQKARVTGTSRSAALAAVLEERRSQEWAELFAEGCREFAAEMRETAARTHAAQAEIALREQFDAD
ncbi:MAG: ribbon-helix-helix protein, CopG family [Chloroflexi bacterium]|nr:ribbon-helix-helix protein, CopG family [Chloroflexota bacterium]